MPETEESLDKSLTQMQEGIWVESGSKLKIKISDGLVYVIEIEDVLFRHDSAVFLPGSYDVTPETTAEQDTISGLDVLKTVFIRAKEYPNQKVLIAGHTDTTGNASYNIKLSEKRASSVYCMLKGERDQWVEISDKQHKNEDIQQILKWAAETRGWDCDPDKIDGVIGPKTKTATLNFQKAYNQDFSGSIGEDGVVGKETWGAIFDVYQDELAKLLETKPDKMSRYRDALKWADESKQTVGCGESWPIEAADKNEYRSRINRRTEVLFFDPSEIPPLDCHPEPGKCKKDLCKIYSGEYRRVHLPVHPYARPLSSPTIMIPEQPGSAKKVPVNGLYAYVVNYKDEGDEIEKVNRFLTKNGKLTDRFSGEQKQLDCDREACFYFSHRDDLLSLDRKKSFAKDKSGLPLLGPVTVPCGEDAKLDLDIWAQKDWAIVRGKPVDGVRPDGVRMAEWKESYVTGEVKLSVSGNLLFYCYGDHRDKENQERWRGNVPIDLVQLGTPGGFPMWAGTLSALPTPKAKLLFVHNHSGGALYPTSLNEIAPTGDNQEFQSFHTYNQTLLNQLMAIPRDDQDPNAVNALPNPPARSLLPGDICFLDQGQTNNCGAYSFAAAMNYWMPYTNNPARKSGSFYSDKNNVPGLLIPNGARTPAQILEGASKFKLNARDNDAEEIDKNPGLKLLKLWLQAGVPVLVLVEEDYNLFSLHWKTLVGYDGNRFFINNSGADHEAVRSERAPGTDYEHAPVGNDVDSIDALYNKWKAVGGGLLDAFSSIDECTFIPLYPKDPMFGGSAAR